MKEITGDIFDLYKEFDAICITTNGMIKKSDGKAIMGAGVAKACRDTVKGSDIRLAELLKKNGNIVQVFDEYDGTNVVAFPTKHNWRDKSDIELIRTSACQLMQLIDANGWNNVLLPQPGCTNGQLNWIDVKKELDYILCDRVTIVSKGKILECSSKGDIRFSAFGAKIKIFGKYQSIENHYQLCKRFGDEIPKTWRDAKGKTPTHLHLNGNDYDIKFTEAWYDLLWVKYLDENPKLVEYAKQFDDFNDIFRGKKATVCQADSIRKYIKNGRKSIIDEHKEFIKLMKENKQTNVDKKYYAGIGSRNAPVWALKACKEISTFLMEEGYTLRSGGAKGCDEAFESSVASDSKKEIYLPWDGFEGSNSKLVVEDTVAFEIAKKYHPYWQNLKQGAQRLQARNAHQVLGLTLKDPSDFIVCYTENGKMKGGTAQALRIAEDYKIPVFNIGKYSGIEEVMIEWKKFIKIMIKIKED